MIVHNPVGITLFNRRFLSDVPIALGVEGCFYCFNLMFDETIGLRVV